MSSEDTVEHAVDKLTRQPSATLFADLDGSPAEVRAFLENAGQGASPQRAARLAESELTVALGADVPLEELESYDSRTRLALSLNLGDKDIVNYKSVGDAVYLRLQPRELVREAHLDPRERRQLREVVDLADRLPDSLRSVQRLLRGGWVRLDPDDYRDFGWAVERFARLPLDGDEARGAGSVLDGTELRELLSGLRKVLVEHGDEPRPRASGRGGGTGTERLTVGLPAREVAEELAPAVAPLGVRLRPDRVPDRRVTAELTIRRGVLAGLTLDLAALTDRGGSAHLPLRLRFATGDALSVHRPSKSYELEPQDMLAAFLYGTVHGPAR
ncbi:hypothetical protein [Streptomyces sp. JJ36]|uniref:hypothetical protein n=1 Tax=Streptomyces sp. JJ36 TaxID=2736645 RepID=UPI001F2A6142|nr:hypothetical protein [Streptomyces sp. JJ36]MCF6524704.1 hypothetical protein [Streptomyces sp. JJ36]